ncbi:unnamed protein product, partial [Nesidiocoris tenuis]
AMDEDRKDALTRRPLDFHQEERTRKVETSKWLDHHFGSESAASRSSRESDDFDDAPNGQPTTSFINVTMKSSNGDQQAKQSRVFLASPEPTASNEKSSSSSYFKGISEWSSEERRFSAKNPRVEGGVQVILARKFGRDFFELFRIIFRQFRCKGIKYFITYLSFIYFY